MKRKGLFFFFLILILILGGVVFYFGWIQIQLEENTYAVIFTKLRGYETEIVEPGTFLWRWDRLIPTNMTLHRYTIAPQQRQVSFEGTLPSSEVYTLYLEGSPDFSYALTYIISFTLRPEALPSLLQYQFVTPDTIGSWYENISNRCMTEAVALINHEINGIENSSLPAYLLYASIGENLKMRLAEIFPEVDFHSVEPGTIRLPDMDLYRRGKAMYLSLMEEKQIAEAESLKRTREFTVTEEVKLETLSKYGKLFTEYPILLEYIKITGKTDVSSLDISSIMSEME